MSMFDSLIAQLETSPMVQKAMLQFAGVRDILVATVNRFDTRFGEAEKHAIAQSQALIRIETRLDLILQRLEMPVDHIAPAAEDGLMKLLGESGEEMIVREDFAPIPVVNAVAPEQCGSTFSYYVCRCSPGHEGNHSDQGVEWPQANEVYGELQEMLHYRV